MKKTELSLRQVVVLTVTGLLAPVVESFPGLLARTAGQSAWLTPVLMLPVVLLWVVMLGSLFRAEGSGLFGLLRAGLGRFFGGAATLLYIMWGICLVAEQLERSASRMSVVYGGRGGELMAALVLLLVAWMLCGKRGAVYRAGELFWLAAALVLAAVLIMAFLQVEWSYLLPRSEDWRGQPQSWLDYLSVWGTAIFGTALLSEVPRKEGGTKRVLGWVIVASLAAAVLVAAVLGQTGGGLAVKLSHPFLIVVQGLSLEGALTRLEAPVAALWLLADFCRMALFLAALREAGGERRGNGLVVAGAVLAAAGRLLFPELSGGEFGGLLLGFVVPFCLWIWSFLRQKTKRGATSCGQ